MPNAQDLAQLKDIHLPKPISWWPLAPGWYAVIGLFLIALFYVLYWVHRQRVMNKPKNEALRLLEAYKKAYEADNNAPLMSAQLSELLKRVALVYYPREEVASLQGQAWVDFLTKTSKGLDFNLVASLLLETPYKAEETRSLSPLIEKAQTWIKQRRKPC